MLWQSFLTVIVGQNVLVREGLVGILRAAGFRVADAACSVSDIDMDCMFQQQSVLLIVASDGDPIASIEQIELFKLHRPDASVVIVADGFRLNDVVTAFQLGAKAYFYTKDAGSAPFIRYLELVMMGETIVPRTFLSLILADTGDYQYGSAATNTEVYRVHGNNRPHLSDRERTILRYLITGDSNKAIARKINIAEATVKVYIKAILRKIQVQNRTQAAIWAMRNDSIVLDLDKRDSKRDKSSSDTTDTLEAVPLLFKKV